MKKMLVLLSVIDGQVIVKGVCELEQREMAAEWASVDKHRFIFETEVVT